jgi:hypothetical protein
MSLRPIFQALLEPRGKGQDEGLQGTPSRTPEGWKTRRIPFLAGLAGVPGNLGFRFPVDDSREEILSLSIVI